MTIYHYNKPYRTNKRRIAYTNKFDSALAHHPVTRDFRVVYIWDHETTSFLKKPPNENECPVSIDRQDSRIPHSELLLFFKELEHCPYYDVSYYILRDQHKRCICLIPIIVLLFSLPILIVTFVIGFFITGSVLFVILSLILIASVFLPKKYIERKKIGSLSKDQML